MKTVYLISCVAAKTKEHNEVKDLYISPLFKKAYKYASNRKPDDIFILSALYGLVYSGEIISPYDKTLNKMSAAEKKDWAVLVHNRLEGLYDLENTKFVFLAGMNYRKYLVKNLPHYEVPMEGLSIGKQLQWLDQNA